MPADGADGTAKTNDSGSLVGGPKTAASSRIRKLCSLDIEYSFFISPSSDIRKELWEIRKTCLRRSKNFLAKSGPLEEGEN